MPSRRDLSSIQGRIINAVIAAVPDVLKGEIAAVAGVSNGQVTHWGTDADTFRQMRMGELVSLTRRWGADVVLGPLAALSGCMVVKVDDGAKACVRSLRRGVYATLGHVEESTGDGTGGSQEEAKRALPDVEAACEEMLRLRDEVRAAAQGRAA
jgi:hypothetical protein